MPEFFLLVQTGFSMAMCLLLKYASLGMRLGAPGAQNHAKSSNSTNPNKNQQETNKNDQSRTRTTKSIRLITVIKKIHLKCINQITSYNYTVVYDLFMIWNGGGSTTAEILKKCKRQLVCLHFTGRRENPFEGQ